MFRTVSGITLIVFAGLLFLQSIPIYGLLLMVIGMPFLLGFLVNVFLLALAIEGFVGRIPRVFIAVPFIAYGTYYSLYILQGIDIARTSAALRSSNSGKILDFDADAYSLVTPSASALVRTYAIAVAYETNVNFQPEQHLSFRLIRRDQCKLGQDSLHRIQVSGAGFGGRTFDQACVLSYPESPLHKVISVEKIGDKEFWKRKAGIAEQVHQVLIDGKIVGIYKTASVWRLPLVPIPAIGCFLSDRPRKAGCSADFDRTHVALDTVPNGIDRERFNSPESVMLGIPKYTAQDFADFRGYSQNEALLARLADEPRRVDDQMFALLEELVQGGYPKVPMQIGFAVAKYPARLAPLAEAMASRFIELSNLLPARSGGQEYYSSYYEGLARALIALPDEAFKKTAPPLFAYFVEGMSSDNPMASDLQKFSDLTSRIQHASSPQTPDFYEADFFAARGYRQVLPTLAICRIGRARPAVIAEMKERMLRESENPSLNDDNKTALVVTLLKLGEGAFVHDNKLRLTTNAEADFEGWLDSVLAGKGTTDVGPNNCMSKSWNGRRATKPSLRWANGVWYVDRNQP
ncbi:MAG: hypothetical protein V4458_03885 [Pseudomonadota bacterium]